MSLMLAGCHPFGTTRGTSHVSTTSTAHASGSASISAQWTVWDSRCICGFSVSTFARATACWMPEQAPAASRWSSLASERHDSIESRELLDITDLGRFPDGSFDAVLCFG